MAGGIFEPAHVFGHAKNRHVYFLKHQAALAGNIRGGRLRGGHDEGAVERQGLHQGKLRIAGARWHIDQENINFAPLHILDELLNRFHDHRPAPNDRSVVVHQKAHRHDFNAMALERHERFAINFRPTLQAHHEGNGRAINIAVHEPHATGPTAQLQDLGEGASEVDRKR